MRITMNFNKFSFLLWCSLLLSSTVLAQSDPFNPSTWTVNQADFSEVMTITGAIEINNVEVRDTNYAIVAFINGECRSLPTQPLYVEGLDRYIVTLFVYDNPDVNINEVEFWVHNKNSNLVLPVTENLPFTSADPVGSLDDPYIFNTLQVGIEFKKEDVWCAADSSGKASVKVSFGDAVNDFDYKLLWSTGSTQDGITNLGAGTYYLTVTVEDAYSFVDSVEIININRPIQKPNLLAAPSTEVCVGDDIFVFAYSNETLNPVYIWYDIFNKPLDTAEVYKVLNLQSNTLIYAQTEVRNCFSELSSISLKAFQVSNPNFTVTPQVAEVGETVKFTNLEIAFPNTSYRWNFGDGTILNSGATVVEHVYQTRGTFRASLRITTAQGCVREETRLVTILDPPPPPDDDDDDSTDPLLFSFNVNDALCSNDRSGSITTQVYNGSGLIRYSWSNGATTSSLQNLLPGLYRVTITDATGKKGVGSATIISKYNGEIQPPALIVNGGRPVCESGSAWVAAILNYPEAEVYWYNSASSSTPIFQGNPLILFDIQENTSLYVEIKVGSCASTRVQVNVPVQQLYSEFNASATIAPPNLPITFTSIGGDATQTYVWEFGDGNTATGVSINHIFRNPGIYQVKLTATSANGCSETSTKTIRITEQSALGVAFNIQNVRCAEDTDGSIAVEVASGTPPYFFLWNTGATGSVLSNLGVGTYRLTITDQSGASSTHEIAITSDNPPIDIPSVTINGGEVVCVGEDVILAAITNVADAEYRWYDAPVNGNLLYNGASFPLNNLQESQEVFVEAFFNGCFSPGRASTLVSVTGPDAAFTASTKTINEGGTIDFNAKVVVSSNTYAWDFDDGSVASGATTQKTFENTGVYTVTLTVTDSVGCSASTAQVIRVVSAADMVVSLAIQDVTCVNDQNGAVTATVFNGKPPFTFQWSNGATGNTLSNLRTGNYVVTVTDSEGQSLTETAEVVSEVGILNPPTVAIIGDSIVCPSESVSVYAYNSQQNGLSYYWYDAAAGGNLLAVANVFNVYGRDIPSSLFVETRVGACKSDARSMVNVRSETLNTGFSATNTTIVEGNQITFTPNVMDSTYTYSWFFSDGNISGKVNPTHTFASPGTYRVRLDVQSQGGCLDSKFLNINVISANETALILKTTAPACEGDANGKIIAEVINGALPYTFAWSNGATNATLDSLTAGIYTVTFTDADGSAITKTVTLNALAKKPIKPTITVNANSPICYKDDVLLTGTSLEAVGDYLWYNHENNLLSIGSALVINDIDEAGTFYLEVQKDGCTSERVSAALEVQIPDASFTVSQNGFTTVNETLAFLPTVATYPVYTWNFGDGNNSATINPTHTYANAGTFDVSLTVKDADGCINTVVRQDLVNIVPTDILKLAFNTDDILCAADSAGSVTVTPGAGTPPYAYLWSNGASGPTASGLAAGNYAVTVTDAQGRVSIGNASIQNRNIQVPSPIVTVNGNAPVCKGSDAFLLGKNSQFANAKTLWFDSNTAQNPLLISELYVVREMETSRVIYAASQVDGCNSTRIPVEISVQAPSADFRVSPSPEVMEGDVVQFRLTQMNPAYTYYWEFGDNGWSTSPEPYYFYNLGGKFDVKLTVVDKDGCEATVTKQDFVTVNLLAQLGTDPVEIRDNQANNKASDIQAALFPNPFQQDINVVLKVETSGSYRLQLTDLLGRVQLIQDIEMTANAPQKLQLNVGDLSNGFYLLHIENEHAKVIHKLLKQGL